MTTINQQAQYTHHNVMDILQQYENQNRWMLLVAPHELPAKEQLKSTLKGADKVLVIHRHQIKDALHIIQKAMTSGNFSTVLSWDNSMSFEVLEALAETGSHLNCDFHHINAPTPAVSRMH